jgi:single-strand DNA-binding protein
MNIAMLSGNVGRDIELNATKAGTPVCNISVATSEFRKSKDGGGEKYTEWHRVVVFGKSAEFASTYFSKGDGIVIRGKLQTTSFEGADGVKKYSTEIVADQVEFPAGRKAAAPAAGAADEQMNINDYS